MIGYRDLLICMRCHAFPEFCLDTLDAIRSMTCPTTTRIVCAVDGRNKSLAKILATALGGQGEVYSADRKFGWGAGLWSLLAKSILEFESRFRFGHFVTVDYDTLFIKPGADEMLLSTVTDAKIGLIGHYSAVNEHWAAIFHRERDALSCRLGGIPKGYIPGEGTQGGCFMITRAGIDGLRDRGLLRGDWLDVAGFTSIADDHLAPLLVRAAGLDVVGLPSVYFNLQWRCDRDPVTLNQTRVKVFHPTKIRPEIKDRGVELRVRNFYRGLRGREPLK